MVFDVQGSLVGELEAHGYFKKYTFLKRLFWSVEYLITRMSEKFVCSSQNTVDILIKQFNVAAENVVLVNDGPVSELETAASTLWARLGD